jgi:dCTP deaminase
MGIVPDFMIHALCKGHKLIEPYEPILVNPASIDLRLGHKILVELENPVISKFYEIDLQDGDFELMPGQFILAETLEVVTLPPNLAAYFSLKSSRAREGLEHLMAGYVDPGWNGKLTLELKNSLNQSPITLIPGMRIGQLVFHRMEAPPVKDYSETGRYQGATCVEASKG